MIRVPAVFLCMLTAVSLAACSFTWVPAKPDRFARLHDRIDQLELEITRGDEQRKNSLRETTAQTKEINQISTERYLFFNAVVRLWTKLHQDLEVISRGLEVAKQDIDYVEKAIELGDTRLQTAHAEFKFEYHRALSGLIEVLCARKPGTWPCLEGPDVKEDP